MMSGSHELIKSSLLVGTVNGAPLACIYIYIAYLAINRLQNYIVEKL